MHVDEARVVLMPISATILFCAAFGLIDLRATDRDAAWTLAVVLAYFVVLSAGPEVEARFIVPFLPLYASAAGIGTDVIGRRVAATVRSLVSDGGSPFRRQTTTMERVTALKTATV